MSDDDVILKFHQPTNTYVMQETILIPTMTSVRKIYISRRSRHHYGRRLRLYNFMATDDFVMLQKRHPLNMSSSIQ